MLLAWGVQFRLSERRRNQQKKLTKTLNPLNDNVQEPIRHRRDDVEPRGEAIPGGVRDGGGEAGLRRNRPPIQNARRFGVREQGELRAVVSPEEDLQGRRPHRRRHRGAHRRRPRAVAVHALRMHQLLLHLRVPSPCRKTRRSARRQGSG